MKKKIICDIPNDNLCVFNHMIVMRTLIMRDSEKKTACMHSIYKWKKNIYREKPCQPERISTIWNIVYYNIPCMVSNQYKKYTTFSCLHKSTLVAFLY